MLLKHSSKQAATIVRNRSIYALDELNRIVEEVSSDVAPDDVAALRGAIGRASSSILESIVEPLIRAHPDLELQEDEWTELALKHRR